MVACGSPVGQPSACSPPIRKAMQMQLSARHAALIAKEVLLGVEAQPMQPIGCSWSRRYRFRYRFRRVEE